MKHKTKQKSYVSVMIIAYMPPFMHLVVYVYIHRFYENLEHKCSFFEITDITYAMTNNRPYAAFGFA